MLLGGDVIHNYTTTKMQQTDDKICCKLFSLLIITAVIDWLLQPQAATLLCVYRYDMERFTAYEATHQHHYQNHAGNQLGQHLSIVVRIPAS